MANTLFMITSTTQLMCMLEVCYKRGHFQAARRSVRVNQVDTHTNHSDAFLSALGDTANHT